MAYWGGYAEIQEIVRNRLIKNCGETSILPISDIAVYPSHSCEVRELEKVARREAGKTFLICEGVARKSKR